MWVIDGMPMSEGQHPISNATKSTSERVTKGTIDLFHRRMGHIAKATVAHHLPNVANDIRNTDLKSVSENTKSETPHRC